MAASTAPAARTLHLSLFSYLIKRKVWLVGIGMVLVASVCQAIALATGPVALVQPIFIIELPFTLLVASRLARRKLPQQTWWAVGLVTVALGIGLAAAAPSGGGTSASLRVWAAALIVTGCFEAVVITIGVRTRGNARGAAFGLAAACGYALTATLLKSAVAALDQSVAAFFSSWELYGTAVARLGALAARVHPDHSDHLSLVLAAACWLAVCAVPLACTDFAVQRLPDPLTGAAYAGTAALLLAAAAVGGPWSALVRALLGGLAL